MLILQIILSLLLILAILVQPGGKGFGKSSVGSGSFEKRGLERLVFRSTFVLLFLFIAVSIYQLAV